MIIFYIFYPPFIIYYSFLFSDFIDSKYIIIGLCLIGIELFSLLFNIFLKNFRLIHFFLFATFLSLIGLIFFSAFWIKSWFRILYMSIFWLITNGCYILWHYAINKLCDLELDEYFFSALIFDYNIILAFSFLIKYCFNSIISYIRTRIDDNSDEIQRKKYFYLYNFIILIIQYAIIITSIILGFQYKYNEMLIESDASLEVKYTPFLVFIFISCIVILCLNGYKTNKWLIIFHILNPPFIIYYSFLFSSFIDSKYIIIGLSLVGIELLSLLFNIFLKKFETKHFFLFASFLSLIGLIFFSVFWIKSGYPILFMSIIWLISIGVYIYTILAMNHYCDSHEFLYSSLIFDYNIILGIIFCIYNMTLCFCSFCEERRNNQEIESLIKMFGILLLQHVVITIAVWVGFSFGWNDGLREDFTAMGWIIGIVTVVNCVICINFLVSVDIDYYEGCTFLFGIIFYVPMMIIYFYAFSRTIENKFILSFVFILFFDFLSILLCIFFCNSHLGAIFGSCFVANIFTIIPFHFCWLNDGNALIWLIVLSIITDAYLTLISYLTNKKYKDEIIFSVYYCNFAFCSSIYYLMYRAYKCLEKNCK